MELYALLANPNFSETPTILTKPILEQNTGRDMELDVMRANTANLYFHSYDVLKQ